MSETQNEKKAKKQRGILSTLKRLVMRLFQREQYILFAGHCYYANGGAEDFRGFYRSVDAAKQDFIDRCDEIRDNSYVDNWGQIVDRETMRVLLCTRADYVNGDYNKMAEHEWTPPGGEH